MAERAYFLMCLGLGHLLRSASYSSTRIVLHDGEPRVRKHRRFHAPLLIWLGAGLLRVLDVGVRVLPRREWEARERRVYRELGRGAVQVDPDGGLVLPHLPGDTLASLLEDPSRSAPNRMRGIELAVIALYELHERGLTHGDAMAENVLVDLDAGVAHWLDFETLHDPDRPRTWRRADDVRALVTTALLRTHREARAQTLRAALDAYPDVETTRGLAAGFTSILRRPLIFHLAQAGLSFGAFEEIGNTLRPYVEE